MPDRHVFMKRFRIAAVTN